MASSFVLSFIALISIAITIPLCMSSPKTPLRGFETRLIHRDSPESPLYNPSLTRAQRKEAARRRSIARQNYLTRRMSPAAVSNATARIDYDNGVYVMRYKIGTPPIDTYGYFDTASTLIWMQCNPCKKCYNQSIPIFEPGKSSSYRKLMCDDDRLECGLVPDNGCPSEDGSCTYITAYEDGGSSEGVASKETFMLEGETIPDMTFGCGLKNSDTDPDENPPGVVGAGREPSSLVAQLIRERTRFSFCISPFNRGNRSNVKFGSKAVIHEGNQTPLFPGRYGWYHIGVEGISVEGTRLNISEDVFRWRPEGRGGIVIDTGTTYTHLASEAYYAVQSAVINALPNYKHKINPHSEFLLCYDSDDGFHMNIAPDIEFHFRDDRRLGFDYTLDPNNVWNEDNCMTIKPDYHGLSVLGINQLENVNVGIDFQNNIVTFEDTDDCRDT
ncbi:aspartic proteinase nepenthesin-1-like [Pyrus communis]|uniref:aspartic proteinase nepenthesin-1-like n=1 Tax=Pyrus communis TaxID=23211 RepID=UPI0035C19033